MIASIDNFFNEISYIINVNLIKIVHGSAPIDKKKCAFFSLIESI